MSSGPVTVEEWKRLHRDELVECRLGGTITKQACRKYQCRDARYVIHFAGHDESYVRPNSDYVLCMIPDPCPHLLGDDDIEECRPGDLVLSSAARNGRSRTQVRHREKLVNPDYMLEEPDWHRSLITR